MVTWGLWLGRAGQDKQWEVRKPWEQKVGESQSESQGRSHKASNTVWNGDEVSTFVTGDWAHGSHQLLSLWMLADQGGVSDQWALVLSCSRCLCSVNINWMALKNEVKAVPCNLWTTCIGWVLSTEVAAIGLTFLCCHRRCWGVFYLIFLLYEWDGFCFCSWT